MCKRQNIPGSNNFIDSGYLIEAIYFLPIKGKYVSPMLVNRL